LQGWRREKNGKNVIGQPLIMAGLRGRQGPVGLIGGGALGRGLTSHVSRLMAGTVGTFGTVGNDALDTRD